MDKILETRVKRLCAKPLEFWPFQAGLAADERAYRGARGLIYIGLANAYHAKKWAAGMWFVVAAGVLVLLMGQPSKLRLDDESLKSVPNPAGNAPVGDLTGRNPDVPATSPSLSLTDFVQRMQNPIRADDYQILPVAAPNQAHQIFGDTTTSSDVGSRGPLMYQPRT